MSELTINFAADFNNPSGEGRHARCFAAALAKHARILPLPLRQPKPDVHGDAPPLRPARWDEAATGICLATVGMLKTVPGAVQIFSTVWETTRLPPPFVRHLARADQIWVPTAWGRDLFVTSGVDAARIRIVPEGVDSTRFTPPEETRRGDRFRFLSVGKWEERKGSADLVRTFLRTFGPDEPVELVMHAHHPFLPTCDVGALIDQERRGLGRDAAPVLVSDPTDLPGLVRLMQHSDAFVLPTRAEAWGLPILEAMACGRPCIVTDYGGHLAFANENNSYLIAVKSMEWAYDPVDFPTKYALGKWAQPDLDHLAHLMRHVFHHGDEARAKGAIARRDAVERWSWDSAARIAIAHIGELLAARAPLAEARP